MTLGHRDTNAEVRNRAFLVLDALKTEHGDALPREDLVRGFEFEGVRVPLLGPSGIFKPRILSDAPLSITTAPEKPGVPRPYEDRIEGDSIYYKYRGTDPQHRDNVGLRSAMSARIPLVYFRGLVPGRYFAEYPTFVVADDPRQLTFTVQCDDRSVIGREEVHGVAESGDSARREYITRLTRQRMHQQAFRERVLLAYHQCCAVCRIRHRPLLDAAHIVADSDPLGIPIVANGLSLCKIHHAAFDYNIMGIRPDLIVEVREDVLREVDGPMLKHGIQELHHTRLLVVPHRSSDKPRTDFLEERYRQFRAAG